MAILWAIIANNQRRLKKLPPEMPTNFCFKPKKKGLTNIEISDYAKCSKKTVEAQITRHLEYSGKIGEKKYDMLYLFFR